MQDLATLYRAAQLYAHNAHNVAKGSTFFEDHEHLGELYGTYEKAYDDIIERIIGLGRYVDLIAVNRKACALAAEMGIPNGNETAFKELLDMERSFRSEIEGYTSESVGTLNFLQGLADESEKRTYLLGRRLA